MAGRVSAEHGRPDLLGWTLYTGAPPVAVTAADSHWPDANWSLLHDLAGAVIFGVRQVEEAWRRAHEDSSVSGYVLALRAVDPLDPQVMFQIADTSLRSLGPSLVCRATVDVACQAFVEAASADITTGRAAMASAMRELLVRAGVATADADVVEEEWRRAKPTLVVQLLDKPTARNDLAQPLKLEPALVAEVDRRVAQAVAQAAVHPGDYTGDAAKALDRDVFAPAALDILRTYVSRHRSDELVAYGMVQLERIVAYRDEMLRDVERAAAALSTQWDPVTRWSEIESEYLLLRRCAESVVESALRVAPNGNRSVDGIAWAEILAAADVYLTATMRSESVHHQVQPTALRISDSYEVMTIRDESAVTAPGSVGSGHVYDLDMQSLRAARAAIKLSSSEQSMDTRPEEVVDAEPDPAPASHGRNAVPVELDKAVRAAYGASATDLLTTLFALASWPLSEGDPDAVVVPNEALVDYVLDATVIGEDEDGRERVVAAITSLSSSTADLQAADWKPWHARTRRRRLLVQPLPRLSTSSFVVAPHFCLASTGVYMNYLHQGQLPWSQPEPPKAVKDALAAMRDARNHELEAEVAQALRDIGWSVVERVKENASERINVPRLSGEIDVLAGTPTSSTIWLIEVKDPVDTFVVPEIRRHLDRFYAGDGKDPAYKGQLDRKIVDVAPHAAAVATALGLPTRDTTDDYVVKPMFVTRWPVPAAFVGSPIPFASLPELVRVIENAATQDDPERGAEA
jgi:hypothetical protein